MEKTDKEEARQKLTDLVNRMQTGNFKVRAAYQTENIRDHGQQLQQWLEENPDAEVDVLTQKLKEGQACICAQVAKNSQITDPDEPGEYYEHQQEVQKSASLKVQTPQEDSKIAYDDSTSVREFMLDLAKEHDKKPQDAEPYIKQLEKDWVSRVGLLKRLDEEQLAGYGFPLGLQLSILEKFDDPSQYNLPKKLKKEKDENGQAMVLLNDRVLNDVFKREGGRVGAQGFHSHFWLKYGEDGWGSEIGYERIVLKSHQGHWLCADDGTLVPNREELGPYEKFTPRPQGSDVIAIFTDHQSYVTCNSDNQIVTEKTNVSGVHEHFHVYKCMGEGNRAGQPCLAFKNAATGKFLSSTDDQTTECKRETVGPKEKWYGWR